MSISKLYEGVENITPALEILSRFPENKRPFITLWVGSNNIKYCRFYLFELGSGLTGEDVAVFASTGDYGRPYISVTVDSINRLKVYIPNFQELEEIKGYVAFIVEKSFYLHGLGFLPEGVILYYDGESSYIYKDTTYYKRNFEPVVNMGWLREV